MNTQEVTKKNEATKNIFGNVGFNRINYMGDLASRLPIYTYKFMGIEEYKAELLNNFDEGSKVYWLELLERAHWASITTIYRTLGWASGTANAYLDSNYLLFCAGFRGFLESSVDSFYSLINVPESFAKLFSQIKSILNGIRPKEMILYENLEDFLIHFTYARNPKNVKNDAAQTGLEYPPSHYAETIRTYINGFDKHKDELHKCYSELCEITHPSMRSVFMYVAESNDNYKTLRVRNNFNEVLILDFCSRYKELAEYLASILFNTTMITLKVINAFDIPEIETPYVDHLNFSHIELWKDIKKSISESNQTKP